MICFMFPGQPLAHDAGCPDNADFAEISALTLDRTGLDLATFAWRDEPATAQVGLQVYGTAMSLYRNRVLRAEGARPAMVAEHSMGIYAALAAVNALPEGDALELTCRIGRVLAGMSNSGNYALGCVTGLAATPVLALAENNGVYPANYNTSRHFLLAGEQHAIEAAMAEALATGAFSVSSFISDAPLHTPLLEAIAGELRGIVADYCFAEPTVPLMEHIEQDFLAAADIPDFLVRELCLPVRWEATYLALRKAGVTSFAEAGVGESLKKYNRWIAMEHS
ncbi:acyltransferase domain-containing protein [Geobacter pelophilus]|uniref:[acyl-carrier-protein] S-malonyltransferase n=1 Tax=Geoanaerobacter pelophilus TaxID=60036 RepID=A0AAW4KXJ5_9BACT|nr:acyltransferase domain-containing protein [Geoanaerobacter pelophilus]MBT0663346.1 acyltransferase domain-containing protein [Geoanaerobacter pelophilus]